MNKRTRTIILAVVVLAAAGYIVYRYIHKRSGQGTGTGALGTNLNSVAPELVGGSSGPSVGPAVQLPINITMTSTVPANSQSPVPGDPQTMANNQAAIPALNAADSASAKPTSNQTAMHSTKASHNPVHSGAKAAGHPATKNTAGANSAHKDASSPTHKHTTATAKPAAHGHPATVPHNNVAKRRR